MPRHRVETPDEAVRNHCGGFDWFDDRDGRAGRRAGTAARDTAVYDWDVDAGQELRVAVVRHAGFGVASAKGDGTGGKNTRTARLLQRIVRPFRAAKLACGGGRF